jgi:hypothetical protein
MQNAMIKKTLSKIHVGYAKTRSLSHRENNNTQTHEFTDTMKGMFQQKGFEVFLN